MRELTDAQKNFILGVKDHVTYRTIGRCKRTAKALQDLGFVTITNGYFAFLTDEGQKLKQDLRNE